MHWTGTYGLKSAKSSRIWIQAILWITIVVATALRMHDLTESFWIDEILSYESAIQPLPIVLQSNSYPLSYILIHFALQFGDTESILRLPSLLAGVAGVWLMYFLGKACHSRTVGLVASLLLALNSAHILYSQDGRFYSLMPLASIITLWAFTKIIQTNQGIKYYVFLFVGVMIGSLTHPFFFPFLLAVGIGTLTAVFLRPKNYGKRVPTLFKIGVGVSLGLVPLALVYLNFQSLSLSNLVNSADSKKDYLLSPVNYFNFQRLLLLFQNPHSSFIMLALAYIGGLIFLFRRKWKSISVLSVPFLLPIPLFFITVTHWYTHKYFISILPSLLIFVSIFIVEASRYFAYVIILATRHSTHFRFLKDWIRSGILPIILLIIILELFVTNYYARNLYNGHFRPNWKEFAENIGRQMSGDDIIVHFAPMALNPYTQNRKAFEPTPYTFNFYLKRQAPKGRADIYPTKHLLTISQQQLDHWLRQYPDQTFWLVYWITDPSVPVSPAQSHLFKPRVSLTRGNVLFVAGAPTKNLIRFGDFENVTTQDYQIIGINNLVNRSSPIAPGNCLNLSVSHSDPVASIRFPINVDKVSDSNQRFKDGPGYVFSMEMKYDNVSGDVMTSGALVVSITGVGPDGTNFRFPLQTFQGNSDWDSFSINISNRNYPTVFAGSKLAMEVNLKGSTGGIWLDNVQFEAGDHPTPFTRDERLPHDLALDLLEEKLKTVHN